MPADDRLTDADLVEWLRLCAEATPGPWRVAPGVTHLEVRAAHQRERSVARVYCDLDAAFVAFGDPARVRAALVELCRLRAALADQTPGP